MTILEVILTDSTGLHPTIVHRTLFPAEVEVYRHIHCSHYERCLCYAMMAVGKRGASWACPLECAGRDTFVEFPSMAQLGQE